MEKGTRTMNPLDIPSIVSQFMDKLSFQEILNARLVCRLWAEEAIKTMTNKTVISILLKSGTSHREDFMKFIQESETSSSSCSSTIENYSSPVLKSKISISGLSKFHLRLSAEKHDVDIHNDYIFPVLFRNICSSVGEKIYLLDLHIPGEWSIMLLAEEWKRKSLPVLESLTIYLNPIDIGFIVEDTSALTVPSVKSLKLNHHQTFQTGNLNTLNSNDVVHMDYAIQNFYPPFPAIGIKLMRCFPHLESFSFDNRFSKDSFAGDLIKGHGKVGFINPNPHLKHLNLPHPLSVNEEEVIALLQKFKYPLQTLRLSLRPGLRFPALYSFLSSLGSTLMDLELDFVLTPTSQETFPCGSDLINLRNLSLKNYFGPLDFLHYTKKLETLSLTNVNLSVAFADEPITNHDDDESLKLKSLEIFSSGSSAGRISFVHIFRNISKFFPQLKRLRMDYVSDSNLQMIVKGCPLLEELILVNSVCTDQGISGLANFLTETSEELLTNMENENSIRELASKSLIELGYNEPRLPSIATLENLKKLHINAPCATDISMIFGLSQCKNLEELCIAFPMMTPTALKSTVKQLQLKSLRLNHCYKIFQCHVRGCMIKEDDITKSLFPDQNEYLWPIVKSGKCDVCGVGVD